MDVYGIGNALVDIEIECSPEFLKENQVEKGLMTLVDETRQAELLNALGDRKLNRSCGGSAANTVIAVAQLGGNAFYSCKIAADEMGDFFFRDLEKLGVMTNASKQRAEGITGRCMVFTTPDADRTMNTFLGITEKFSVEELVLSELEKAKYLYIEGYLVTSETGRAAAIEAHRQARKAKVKTALTLSDPAIVNYFRDGFKEILDGQQIDLLFCNEEEAISFTESSSLEEAATKLKEVTRSFAITLGPKGALVFDGSEQFEIAGLPVKAVDTNGAGDLFAGCYLYGITNGVSPKESGELACRASAQLVQKMGARLSKEQIEEIKDEVLG